MDTLPTTIAAIPDSLWDENHPRSLINLVSAGAQEVMLATRQKRLDLFEMTDERELYNQLCDIDSCEPTPTDNRLRMNFWDEYDKCQNSGRKFVMANVVAGVCQPAQLIKYFSRPEKLSWILMRPTKYKVFVEEALNFASMRMRQILSLDPVDPITKKLDKDLANLQAKIYLMMELRSQGAVAQRIEQKNLNMNVSTTHEQVEAMGMAKTTQEMDNRIKELERRDRKALNTPLAAEPIEAEVTKSGT